MGLLIPLVKLKQMVANDGITSSSFTFDQMATIAGQKFKLIHAWHEAGIVLADGEGTHPREHRSSFSTAFAVGVCGSLLAA